MSLATEVPVDVGQIESEVVVASKEHQPLRPAGRSLVTIGLELRFGGISVSCSELPFDCCYWPWLTST
jgi:hypothetical protein